MEPEEPEEPDIFCPNAEKMLKLAPFMCFVCGIAKTSIDFGGNVWSIKGEYVLFHCCITCKDALIMRWRITFCSKCKAILAFDDFEEIPQLATCPACKSLFQVKIETVTEE